MASNSIIKVCRADWCRRPVRSRGMCASHYTIWHRGGEVPGVESRCDVEVCIEEGCDRPVTARHWCVNHYQRWIAAGRPADVAPPKMRHPRTLCAELGCDELANARGLCPTHYARSHRSDADLIRANNLWTNYRMTLAEYDDLFARQGGVCAICGAPPADKRLAVDHDHGCCSGPRSCGSCVRGLLCQKCNHALGLFGDKARTLSKAIEYLQGNRRG